MYPKVKRDSNIVTTTSTPPNGWNKPQSSPNKEKPKSPFNKSNNSVIEILGDSVHEILNSSSDITKKAKNIMKLLEPYADSVAHGNLYEENTPYNQTGEVVFNILIDDTLPTELKHQQLMFVIKIFIRPNTIKEQLLTQRLLLDQNISRIPRCFRLCMLPCFCCFKTSKSCCKWVTLFTISMFTFIVIARIVMGIVGYFRNFNPFPV